MEINVNWSEPISFLKLDENKKKYNCAGLYIWLIEDQREKKTEEKSWTVIYAGKTKSSIYHRNFFHVWETLSGTYPVYFENMDINSKYKSFIENQLSKNKIKKTKTTFFYEFIKDDECFFWPKHKGKIRKFEDLLKTESKDILVADSDNRVKFYESLEKTKLIIGTFEDSQKPNADQIISLETELILRIRKKYCEDFNFDSKNKKFISEDLQGLIAKAGKHENANTLISNKSWKNLLSQIK